MADEQDARRHDPGAQLKERPAQRPLRALAGFEPEAKPVEGPSRRPPQERPEEQIGGRSEPSPAGPVVIAGHEPHARVAGDVTPVARTGTDQREPMLRREPQRGRAGAVRPASLTDGAPVTIDDETRQRMYGVAEPSRAARRGRRVEDLLESQIPALVGDRALRPFPEVLDVGADQRLDVDGPPPAPHPHHIPSFERARFERSLNWRVRLVERALKSFRAGRTRNRPFRGHREAPAARFRGSAGRALRSMSVPPRTVGVRGFDRLGGIAG